VSSLPPEFSISVDQRGRVRVVDVAGELDVFTAPRLASAVDDDESYDTLVLNLGEVPFMSSVGIGLISSLHRRLDRLGKSVALAGVQPDVASLLEVMGLADVLYLADDTESAIRLLN
jgi:anti-sigma B factor antagonist